MTESGTHSKEEIAREIKQIFVYVKNNPKDTEFLSKACQQLRSKSESGYRGLVRLLCKYGYVPSPPDTTNNSPEDPIRFSQQQQQHNSNLNKSPAAQSSACGSVSRLSGGNGSGGRTGNDGRDNSCGNSCSNANSSAVGGHQEEHNDPANNPEVPATTAQISDNVSEVGSRHSVHSTSSRRSAMSRYEQKRSERYARTKYFLSKNGLLNITNNTADLIKKNKELQQELDSLKQQTESFVDSVFANSSVQTNHSPPGGAPTNAGTLGSNSMTNSGHHPLSAVANSRAGVSGVHANSGDGNGGNDFGHSMMDNNDFTSILSGIYDFELPSVILAPIAVEPMNLPNELPVLNPAAAAAAAAAAAQQHQQMQQLSLPQPSMPISIHDLDFGSSSVSGPGEMSPPRRKRPKIHHSNHSLD